MTTISARISEDSISEAGVRLTTFQLRYPRFFHAELMTHRMLSRCVSSSRAVPVRRMNEAIAADPVVPLYFGKNEPGMQAHEEVGPLERRAAVALWNEARRACLRISTELAETCGVAKQIANRLTEPFAHVDVIVTATDWANFFALRCHPDAEPHFRVLAWRMADLYFVEPHPVLRRADEWHLPYVTAEERASLDLATLQQCSVARCARVSYRMHDGQNPSAAKDIALCTRLLAGLASGGADPGHMSPFEHQATPAADADIRSGNLRGWLQYRTQIRGECASFDYAAAVARGWRDGQTG